ncbi:MAG: BppU family phage baseplate upper protein [Pseudobdellovibrionaceae bacterium]
MISNFQIKAKSTLPHLEVQITKDGRIEMSEPSQCCNGDVALSNVVDLTGTTVKFQMRKCGRTPQDVKLTGAAEIVDAVNGVVQYKWDVNDTYFEGLYTGQFEITFQDNTILVWPYQQDLIVEVL